MEQDELLRYIVGVLERLDIRYLVTGSVATIFYGEPRFTNDVDIVIDLPRGKVGQFCEAFPESQFYLSPEMVEGALTRRGQFNILHPSSGLKVEPGFRPAD